ncbi:MAG: hypothetical protein K0S25_37 [Bacillus sp. (in: firmicutes)]|jgi:hypothetical protein|nr:hypothetical protein [Bacillus sp. (in: firmicutes)]
MEVSRLKDGFVIMFQNDGVIYPIALTQDQYDTAHFFLSALISPVRIIKDQPQGKAVNLFGKKK